MNSVTELTDGLKRMVSPNQPAIEIAKTKKKWFQRVICCMLLDTINFRPLLHYLELPPLSEGTFGILLC